MGYSTDFRGAIRIVPKVEADLAERLSRFFLIRHMRRDVSRLEKLFDDQQQRTVVTLLGDGDFGVEGEKFLPVQTTDCPKQDQYGTEGLMGLDSLNTPAQNCPSLYCDLALIQDPCKDCTYLGWNGGEKAYEIPAWIAYVANLLVQKGYHLDGKIFADVDCGYQYYEILVHDAAVQVKDLEVDATYQTEFAMAQYVLQGESEEVCNE